MEKVLLIVDDENDFVVNLRDHITESQMNYKVEDINDFAKTLDKIKEIKERGDRVVAIFIDICKKDFKEPGFSVIQAVSRSHRDIYIVAFSQYSDHFPKAYEMGANWHLYKREIKDFQLGKLEDRIEKYFDMLRNEKKLNDDWHVDVLQRILDKLSESMRSITDSSMRYAGRQHYEINDEYDLQDLFFVILNPIFPKIVNEDPVSKIAGKSSRADFYIPEISSLLELKHVRTESEARGIFNQLDSDITLYGNHAAERLFFYVLVEHAVAYNFDPMIEQINKMVDYTRGGRTWKSIRCIVKRR